MTEYSARRLWLVSALGFVLRAAIALVSERFRLFPDYYFQDARMYDATAWTLALHWRGQAGTIDRDPSYLAYQQILAGFYFVAGHRVLIAKLFNAGIGAGACAALYALGAEIFSPVAGLVAGIALAVWPSCVFFNSQTLKDNPILLLALLSLLALTRLCRRLEIRSTSRPYPQWLAAGALLLFLSLFRWPTAIVAVGSLLTAQAVCGRPLARGGFLQALVFATALFALHRQVISRALEPGVTTSAQAGQIRASGVDVSAGAAFAALQPRQLSLFRRSLQQSIDAQGRPVQTRLFPDAEFHSWADVACFIPGASFYASFMPLPGLYPLGRKPGRWLAAFENLALLAMSMAGIYGAWRWPKRREHWMLLLYFVGMAVISGLFEPDLGSAARHKLQYLPVLMPFAASLLERKTGASPS